MRILALLVALLLVSVGTPVSARAQSWATYTSEAGRYRVDMPGVPKEVPPTTRTLKDGVSTVASHGAQVSTHSAHYLVVYSDLPPGTLAGLAPLRTLEQERDGAAKGNTLLRSKPITSGGNPGLEYAIAVGNFTGVIRATLVGLREYKVIYTAPGRTEPTSPDVRRFFDSFAPN